MLHTAAEVKEMLTKLIHHLKSTKSLYVKNPEKDFTRERKLSFEKVITCLLGMGGGSLANELMDQFGCCADLVTVSAFIQQRNKLLPSALETLFHLFVEKSECSSLYKGYRLLAVDGSALQIPTDKDDMDSFFPRASNKEPYNLLHLNAMYDLIAHTYTDAILQKGRVRDEIRALTDMVDRAVSSHPTILLADRGFESYNVFAHVQEKGWHYLIRVKDGGVNGGIGHGLDLPSQDEFDVPIHLLLTRSQSKENKKLLTNRNKYKHIHYSQNFDFLPQKVDSATPALFYELSFRLVRFRLPNGTYETVITNLDPESFPSIELKQLYALRWGIENSFRQLKHTVGLLHFHAKKAEFIQQEVFARLLMYNFTELITALAVIHRDDKRYTYQANFSVAMHICRLFIRSNTPSNPEIFIAKFITPIRPGRSAPRVRTAKSFANFSYRTARSFLILQFLQIFNLLLCHAFWEKCLHFLMKKPSPLYLY